MPDVTSALAAAVIFATVLFFILGLATTQTAGNAAARQRLEGLTRGGFDELPAEARPFSARVLLPALHGVARGFGSLLPKSLLNGVEKKLVIAGEPMNMSGFLTMVTVATGSSVGFGLIILVAAGSAISIKTIGIVAVIGLIGFYLPFWIVNSRARQRQASILKKLPDAFDLITTCVEAGLGLDAALSRVAEKVEGPFAQELARSLRDIALGKSRRDALKELGERTAVADLVQFTNAVVQAEAMGSSIGTVLRVQADQLRVRRRQRAEEAAYKAPVKMLFPLVLFIFPTLFIVILGPAAITITQGFPK
ncbi:MAG: type II secretion system F family protein [Dehalococcoidia bacterium]|nr:type II secretion system F family protein [Dehalococcoidia bacterium]